MSPPDRPHFVSELNMLGAVLKGHVTEPLLMAFWQDFEDVTFEDFRVACKRARRELDFFPSVRELRSFLPRREQPMDPQLKRLLDPWVRNEPWPEKGQAPIVPRYERRRPEEAEWDRAVSERMRKMNEGNS